MLRIDGQIKFSEYQTIYDVVVPKNHILRKIADEIDFSFVNRMLEASYCKNFGRPAKELEEMLTESIRQAIDKGLIKSRAIIVDSTHTYSKGNPETPTQILRGLTKGLRREIYQTQPELAEYFPEKPLETAEIEEELEYTKKLIEGLKGKLSYKASVKQQTQRY